MFLKLTALKFTNNKYLRGANNDIYKGAKFIIG